MVHGSDNISFISLKWGVPFIFQKVLLILNFIFLFKFVGNATALIYIFFNAILLGESGHRGPPGGGGGEGWGKVDTDNRYLC